MSQQAYENENSITKITDELIINAKHVNVIRGSKYILKDINWTIKNGEHWVIMGLNGSGKTTLLDMVNGYIFPSDGELRVLGKMFGRYDLRELRKSIGWVSTALQEKLYKNETAVDIVLSGKFATIGLFNQHNQSDMELAKSLLERLDILKLSEQTYKILSQGEKQRVLIARGLMSSPRLLILDEPCTGLDIFAKAKLLNTIESIAKAPDSPTIIFVTHLAEEILPTFSHTLLLRRGQVHSLGKTKSILTEENLSDFFETPVIIEKENNRFFLRLRSK